MAKNDFKAFAIGENANVLSQNEYEELEAIKDGFQAGIARSEQLNKVWRQASTIAAVVAQFMVDKSGENVVDDGNLEKLRDTLAKALLNNSTSQLDGRYLKSSFNLSDVTNATTARGNLGLKGAALQDVGTVAGTVAAGNDSRIVNAVQRGNNLSDLTDKAVARTSLGLGTAATHNIVSDGSGVPNLAASNSWGNLQHFKGGVTTGNAKNLQNGTIISGSDGAMELYGSTPYIDFHYGNSTADYTSRIIERSSGTLSAHCHWIVTGTAQINGKTNFLSGINASGSAVFTNNGHAVTLKPATNGQQVFLAGKKYDDSNHWYIGQGENNSDRVHWLNYRTNTYIYHDPGLIKVGASQALFTGEIVSSSANAFRMIYGDRGVFWRQDSVNLYLMLTNAGEPYGTWNNLRPFQVNLANGSVNIGNGLTVTGTVTPTNYTNFDARYQTKNTASKAANGWFKDTSTGMIFQWGRAAGGNDDQYYTVTLPIAFPSAFVSLQVYPIYSAAVTSSNILSSAGEIKSNSQFGYGISDSAGRPVTAKGVYWYAVGY